MSTLVERLRGRHVEEMANLGRAFGGRDMSNVEGLHSEAADCIAALEAERDALKAALEDVARQHTADEREKLDEDEGDVEGAYDTAISVARSALQPSKTEGSGG